MIGRQLRVLTVAAILIAPVAPVTAHAGTIVFDFEDGLQGWHLHGSVQRVQTQLLGGEWAIFGDGWIPEFNPFIFPEESALHGKVDLTGIASMDLERLLIEGDRLLVLISHPDPQILTFHQFSSEEEIDLTELVGLWHISISWRILESRIVEGELAIVERSAVGFIDNITFHTIPEPSVLGMLVMGGVAFLAGRRRRSAS